MAQAIVVDSIIASTAVVGEPIVGIEQYIVLTAIIASTVMVGEPFVIETDTLGRITYTAENLFPNIKISSISVDP